MARQAHIWVVVRDTGYAVVRSGKTISDAQMSPRYRDALVFIAGYLDKSLEWVDAEYARVRRSSRAISTYRYPDDRYRNS